MDVKKCLTYLKPILSFSLLMVVCDLVSAAGSGSSQAANLGTLATNVTDSFQGIGKLMVGTAYTAGLGFGVAAIFKFKQHKDNPTQVTIGQPFTLLAVSAALMFLPAMYEPMGVTIFGDTKPQGGTFSGTGVNQLPGEQSSS